MANLFNTQPAQINDCGTWAERMPCGSTIDALMYWHRAREGCWNGKGEGAHGWHQSCSHGVISFVDHLDCPPPQLPFAHRGNPIFRGTSPREQKHSLSSTIEGFSLQEGGSLALVHEYRKRAKMNGQSLNSTGRRERYALHGCIVVNQRANFSVSKCMHARRLLDPVVTRYPPSQHRSYQVHLYDSVLAAWTTVPDGCCAPKNEKNWGRSFGIPNFNLATVQVLVVPSKHNHSDFRDCADDIPAPLHGACVDGTLIRYYVASVEPPRRQSDTIDQQLSTVYAIANSIRSAVQPRSP